MTNDEKISLDQFRQRMEAGDDFTILDARNPKAWAVSDATLPEAIHVPADQFESHIADIPMDKPIVAYCT